VISCRTALTRAGFADCHYLGVLPSLDFPRMLWSIEKGWSRRSCKYQVEALRALVKPSTYLVWRMFAEMSLSQHLCNGILFWGRKIC
jgi:hypothetical protein